MRYYAHSLRDADESKWQPLSEHLLSVAKLAEQFARDARPDDADFARAAHLAGLLHDLGKYRNEFQAMLRGRPKSASTRHKLAGAAYAAKQRTDLAFAIAGHHGGLPDAAALRNDVKGPNGYQVVERYWNAATSDCAEIGAALGTLPKYDNARSFDVAVRLLFSCLVDADWQDTSDFYRRAAGRQSEPPPPALDPAQALSKVLDYIAERARSCRDARMAAIRDEVLRAALAAARQPCGIFTMSVPTGGGKTLSALAFALAHADQRNLRRVIYVAPYLSILEQNVREIRRALGVDEASDVVFEHHSLADPPDTGEDAQAEISDAAQRAEAWNSPIIATTNVQFFESLFANQPGRCRKLHNMARSVILLDECQTLPPRLVAPTCSMLSEFAAQAGASIVLCTATQPALNRRDDFAEGFAGVHEIAPPEMRLFDRLLRVTVAWPDANAAWQWPQVTQRMLEESQVLCIVNTKGAAREVHAELKKCGADDALHLSTNMCPRHRLETIDEVRRRLRSREPCRLVSTQLIEAGVDVDFPVVLREMSPLEAIIQAAGRANREGLLNQADGAPGGRVVVFRAVERVKLDRWYEAGIGVVEADFLRNGCQPDIARPERVAEYFRRLYRSGDLDAKKIQAWREALSFEEVARSYRLIDDATFPVVIATWKKAQSEVENVLNQLRAGWNRRLARRLSPYVVNVRYAQAERYEGLIANGPADMKVWWGPYDEQIGMSSETQADWWVV